MESSLQNLRYALGDQSVDQLNAEFYGQIRYPWPPQYFERLGRGDLGGRMLAQDIGQWDGTLLPADSRVWVAGCGTNQALFTALRFPEARVLGSDLAAESLEVCAANAASLGVANLELRRESIHQVDYAGRFDYILCTGVIHHNADPLAALARLAQALRPQGVLELMVYNQFHRILSSAFQNALRTLLGNPARPDLERELPVARRLIAGLPGDSFMASFLGMLANTPDAAFADTLLQPVEHTFTVASLAAAADRCGLELLTFCNDAFSRGEGETDWNLDFADEQLAALYLALPDVERWQVTNLLLAESSPMLWFYLQRQDCPRPRKPERQICDEFLARRFRRVQTEREVFTRLPGGTYSTPGRLSPYPGEPRHPLARRIAAELDDREPLGETLRRLGIAPAFALCNRLRLHLATSGCPFLEAV